MAKTVLGIIGGSGVYDIGGLENARWERVRSPWGEPSDALLFGRLQRHGHGVPAAPRPRPCPFADLDQLPRQHRRPEARRLHRHDLGLGLRLVPRGTAARHISCLPTSSSTAPSRARRASSAAASSPMSRWPIRCARAWSPRCNEAAREENIACRQGGTYLAMEGPQFSTLAESKALSLLGLRRDRDDRDAGSQARARGRDALRARGDGDRLRLLAPRP